MRYQEYKYTKTIRNWLVLGLLMLIGQVILGGITRLTGSGLSITRWDIITGVIPPLNAADWEEAFNLYKETPQFNKINSTFDLSDFKFIYFWEYLHRLWVRALGIIFLIPFLILSFKRQLNFDIVKRLALVIALFIVANCMIDPEKMPFRYPMACERSSALKPCLSQSKDTMFP